jgi:TorA maturation chaperone TorD
MKNEPKMLVGRALAFRWSSRLFAYPSAELLAALSSPHPWRAMAHAVAAAGGDPVAVRALTVLQRAFKHEGSRGDALALEYTRLFARDVPCPPYESSYRPQGTFSRVQLLSELSAFYAAFGLKVAEAHKELPDHISLQLEFLSILYGKEALALEQGWTDKALVSRDARHKFVAEHLGWLSRFAERLHQRASLSFYPAAIAWITALLAAEPDHAPHTVTP